MRRLCLRRGVLVPLSFLAVHRHRHTDGATWTRNANYVRHVDTENSPISWCPKGKKEEKDGQEQKNLLLFSLPRDSND